MASTKNYKLVKPGYTSSADINELNNNFDKIDKGLTLDVGTSTGNGNNYILDLGSITLNSDNRGLALRFFADKNANGNVVIVINNINYSLLKTNGKNVKNLKSGSPYIIIFNGSGNFFLASGGGNEDETNIIASDVLLNKTFIGQDGEVATGTMPNNGSINANLSANGTCIIPKGYTDGGAITANSLASQTQANAGAGDILSDKTAIVNGNKVTGNIPNRGDAQYADGFGEGNDYYAMTRIPYGYYPPSNNGWAPEVRLSKEMLRNALGVTQEKIISGQQIAGVHGNIPNRPSGNDIENDYIAFNGERLYLKPPDGNYFSGGAVFASASQVASHLGVTSDKILSGQNIAGVDGNIPNLTGIRNATGVSRWGDNGLAVYPERGYQKGGSGDGEIKVSQSQLINTYGINANKIVSGQEIAGVQGNATIESMGGRRYSEGSVYANYDSKTGTINLPFTPRVVFMQLPDKLYVTSIWTNVIDPIRSCYAVNPDNYDSMYKTTSGKVNISVGTNCINWTITDWSAGESLKYYAWE